jgi:PPM family protein phosphatase
VKLRAAAATHAGKVRSVNQDRWLVIDEQLFVVADGMGGHRGGEVAAQLTVDVMGENVETRMTSDALVERVARANDVVLRQSRADPELSGMGTTVTAIAVLPESAINGTPSPTIAIINVGDSRTYRMRAGELEQLTEDHSVTSELIRSGRLTVEEARNHRQRSVLTRAVGVEDEVDSDVLEVLVAVDDRFLLCSDGLYGEVPDELIGSLLRRLGDAQEAVDELVRTAVARGGRDNVTAVVVDVLSDDNAALIASRMVAPSAQPVVQPAEPVTPPIGVNKRTDKSQTKPEGNRSKRAATTEIPTAPKRAAPKRSRRPFFVNLRVITFFVFLAALGGVVFWTVQQGKEIQNPTSTTVVQIPASAATISGTTTTTEATTRGKGRKKRTASTVATIADVVDPVDTIPLDTAPTETAVDGTPITARPVVTSPFDPTPATKPAKRTGKRARSTNQRKKNG